METSSVPNYRLLLELDQVGEKVDKHCLNGLAVNPPTLAAVICDEDKPEGVRWLSVIGLAKPVTFASPAQATTWLRKHCPRVPDLTSQWAITEFSAREYVHLGQRLTCSRLYGGRAVLLGDAAAAFPRSVKAATRPWSRRWCSTSVWPWSTGDPSAPAATRSGNPKPTRSPGMVHRFATRISEWSSA